MFDARLYLFFRVRQLFPILVFGERLFQFLEFGNHFRFSCLAVSSEKKTFCSSRLRTTTSSLKIFFAPSTSSTLRAPKNIFRFSDFVTYLELPENIFCFSNLDVTSSSGNYFAVLRLRVNYELPKIFISFQTSYPLRVNNPPASPGTRK